MNVVNRTRARTLIGAATIARTAQERRTGLIGRTTLTHGEGMVFPGTKSIHTFGMRFPIDVVFLDREQRVIHIVQQMPCSRVSPLVWRSAMALEMAAGTLALTGTELGDRIEFVETEVVPATAGPVATATERKG